MRSIIFLLLFTVIFGISAFAQESAPKVSELPADMADWVGEDSDQILENEIIRIRLKKLLGEQDYASFMESFETLNPIEKQGDFLFASGCMIRACTHLESAIAIDLVNKTIHAAIYNEIEETKYFNENGGKTPAPIIKWAERLEDLKKTDSDNDTEIVQPEAILISEFSNENTEILLLQLDNYLNRLQNDPMAGGYIIINGNKSSRTRAEKRIKDHIKNRGLDLNRLIFLNGDGNSQALIKLWLVPAGAEPPGPERSADQKESVEMQIIALEKQAWAEWKNGNKRFVENFLTDDAFYVYPEGVINKAQIIQAVGSCEFKSYSLEDFRFKILGKDSALVSYTANQDIVCNGTPAPPVVRSTSVYVKRKGKWLSTFYTETAATPNASDKPLEEKALDALITELKGVVFRLTPNENEAKAVAEKWDKRQDLAGKTKSDVIDLLYEDVKNVIKDSGTQYQIYSTFSFYKNIPD